MEKYDHKKIERKWQERWEKSGAFAAKDDSGKPKDYLLIEFPYPSGDGLHVGHVRSWTAMDTVARKRRAEGKNVLYPIGWDAFGLPTENFALKTGRDPRVVTKENTDNFRRQIKALGISFDWSREINTTDPAYYKWTQWIFLQLFKKGLAYKAQTQINWCPKDKIGLANEEVVDGACERCGTPVEKRLKEQWMLAITKYAQRLYDDLDTVDYILPAKLGQRNWIGPSEGAEIEFAVSNSNKKIKIFTTRSDTLFGATYLVLAPEHPLTQQLAEQAGNKDEILRYIVVSKQKTEIDRTTEGKEKTGVELKGVKAINPANQKEIPVWVADFVLGGYGTGAIFADAHDQRDFDFAKKFNIPLKTTLKPFDVDDDSSIRNLKECYEGKGILYDSGEFSGLTSDEAIPNIGARFGKIVTTYKLRDWVFSRQRYWGEPIPLIQCEKDGWVAVPDEQLPVELPQVEKYQPTDTGESPLANMKEFVDTACPKCGGPAKRETDVMPNWAGSSWYWLRYCDPRNNSVFADGEKLTYWTPVNWYNGGMEHTTLHLLYSRFWHKFLFDLGLVPTGEPYMKRTSHGLILAEDGSKMSKSKGNTVSPDELVERFGADSLRLYEMFIGPFDQPVAWNTNSILGVRRFLEKVWSLKEKVADIKPDAETEVLLNQTVKKVSDDIEQLKMNTAVSALMILANHLAELERVPHLAYTTLVQLLSPFAPHATAELADSNDVDLRIWPAYNARKIENLMVKIGVQVDGKVRATIEISRDTPEDIALKIARTAVGKWLLGPEHKAIYVPGKIINFVLQ